VRLRLDIVFSLLMAVAAESAMCARSCVQSAADAPAPPPDVMARDGNVTAA